MFIEKIEQLARDWGKSLSEMDEIMTASLRYGMRLDRHPGKLKRELKKLKIDSTIATPLWSGNAYLLITMPSVLVNKKKKIPCLADFIYARKVLKKEDFSELKSKVKNLPPMSPHDILKGMFPAIKRQAYSRGRFLPQFDRMYGGIEDIQQDLFVEAAAVVNKQIMNLKTHNIDDIMKYMGFCFKKKSDTYLRANAPKARRVRVEEDKIFEDMVHEKKKSNGEDYETALELNQKEVTHDLESLLSKEAYLGVGLLMNFAPEPELNKFEQFLESSGIKRQTLSTTQTKRWIEKYLGKGDLFTQLQQSKSLLAYLKT